MFTGIIRAIGFVEEIRPRERGKELVLSGIPKEWELIPSESLAVDGVCLTIAGLSGDRAVFALGEETLKRTTLGSLEPGDPVHLEPPLKLSQYLGGHLFLGHVDGVGVVRDCEGRGEDRLLWITAPSELDGMIFPKGAITVQGVSLTINEVEGDTFSLYLIPETLRRTHLGALKPGARVNLEADLISRQVAWLVRREMVLRTGGNHV